MSRILQKLRKEVTSSVNSCLLKTNTSASGLQENGQYHYTSLLNNLEDINPDLMSKSPLLSFQINRKEKHLS